MYGKERFNEEHMVHADRVHVCNFLPTRTNIFLGHCKGNRIISETLHVNIQKRWKEEVAS